MENTDRTVSKQRKNTVGFGLCPAAPEAAARGAGNAVSPLHGPAAPGKTFCGCRLLAVDGSSLKSAAYPEDPASYRPGTPRQHGWNLWHMNALFDLENGIYTDLIVQKEHEKNESSALCQMTDRSRVSGKVILLADRNYESCNNLAHL